MKNLIFTILAFTLFCVNVTAQECGTPTDSPNQEFPYQGGEQFNEAPLCINVFYHIVRQSNGVGGLNPNLLDDVTDLLNTAFNNHNIFIVEEGRNFIDSDQFFNLSRPEFENQLAATDDPNVINIYFVNQSYGPNVLGAADGVLSNSLNIRNSHALTNVTSHELGHCLNLYHTHRNENESGGCQENIARTNCNDCGDYICDTPADPRLGDATVSTTCVYTGTATQGGTPFTPDTRNIMSYSRVACLDSFTEQQGQRMRNTILGSNVLSKTLNEDCLNLNGPDNFCNSATYTLSDVPAGAVITWNVFPTGIANLSANGTTATLTRITDGSVELSANVQINTGTLFVTKDIYIGGADVTNIWGPRRFGCTYGEVSAQLSTYEPNILNYQWRVYGGTFHSPGSGNSYIGPSGYQFVDPKNNTNSMTVKVRVQTDCGWSPYFERTFQVVCSGDGNPPTPLRAYPNPAKDIITIDLQGSQIKDSYSISVLDKHGQVVYSNTNQKGKMNVLNIGNLNAGFYFIQVSDGEKTLTEKIIISK